MKLFKSDHQKILRFTGRKYLKKGKKILTLKWHASKFAKYESDVLVMRYRIIKKKYFFQIRNVDETILKSEQFSHTQTLLKVP